VQSGLFPVIKVDFFGSEDLVIFVAFTGNQDTISGWA